jgi:hypothetical protein
MKPNKNKRFLNEIEEEKREKKTTPQRQLDQPKSSPFFCPDFVFGIQAEG